MKGVFRAPTPAPSEEEVRARQAQPPRSMDEILGDVAFPASRDDLVNTLIGYSLTAKGGIIPGEALARGLRERVYRSLDQLLSETGDA